MNSFRRLGWTSLALFALAGCEPAPAPPGAPTPAEIKKEADAAKLSDKEIAEIKKLPEAEQPVALTQMTCPVSDEHLGEMGTPIKQTIDDKTFYICCESCEAKVKSDPKGVLAKLKK
jgi:YHS domain-containing protein